MFKTVLVANDGSDHAFKALAMAITIAKQNASELHMVSVEEISHMPEFMNRISYEFRTSRGRIE